MIAQPFEEHADFAACAPAKRENRSYPPKIARFPADPPESFDRQLGDRVNKRLKS
jgi:hypothetical protein